MQFAVSESSSHLVELNIRWLLHPIKPMTFLEIRFLVPFRTNLHCRMFGSVLDIETFCLTNAHSSTCILRFRLLLLMANMRACLRTIRRIYLRLSGMKLLGWVECKIGTTSTSPTKAL
jgi:hypothetical protein